MRKLTRLNFIKLLSLVPLLAFPLPKSKMISREDVLKRNFGNRWQEYAKATSGAQTRFTKLMFEDADGTMREIPAVITGTFADDPVKNIVDLLGSIGDDPDTARKINQEPYG